MSAAAIRLTAASIRLAPLTVEDRREFLRLVAASRELHQPFVRPPSSRAAFASYLARSQQPDFVALLVRRREDGALCGVYNLSQIFYGAFCSAYLGYFAFVPFAGRGYMTVGLQATLRYAFVQLKLHRIEANLQPQNRDSRALVQRCGFSLEGYSPRYLKIAGRWRDHERWALRREDWQAGSKLQRKSAGS